MGLAQFSVRAPDPRRLCEAADEAAIEGLKDWATFEDQEDVVEALRLDALDEMTEHLNGTYTEEVVSLMTREGATERAREAGA